jgi:hypothetical protein
VSIYRVRAVASVTDQRPLTAAPDYRPPGKEDNDVEKKAGDYKTGNERARRPYHFMPEKASGSGFKTESTLTTHLRASRSTSTSRSTPAVPRSTKNLVFTVMGQQRSMTRLEPIPNTRLTSTVMGQQRFMIRLGPEQATYISHGLQRAFEALGVLLGVQCRRGVLEREVDKRIAW